MRLSSFLRFAEEALKESDIEARIGFVSVIMLSLAVYSFDLAVAMAVIAVSFAFCPKKVAFGLLASLPFVAFFALASLILGGFEKTLSIIALISVGCLLYGIPPEDFAYSLMFFRFPARFAHSISIAMRMFQVLIRDLRFTSEALKLSDVGGFRYYSKLLRAFSAITVLRAISFAETLYSRGFDPNRRIVRTKKPKVKDWILLIISTLILCYTYLVRSAL